MVTEIQLFEYTNTKASKLIHVQRAQLTTILLQQNSRLTGRTSHPDMQKIHIIGFFFE